MLNHVLQFPFYCRMRRYLSCFSKVVWEKEGRAYFPQGDTFNILLLYWLEPKERGDNIPGPGYKIPRVNPSFPGEHRHYLI